MIGIIANNYEEFISFLKENNLPRIGYVYISSIRNCIGMKFKEVWELHHFIDDIGIILEYLDLHNIPVKMIYGGRRP